MSLIHKHSRQVIDNSTGKIYSSLRALATEMDLNYSTLCLKMSGHRKNRTSYRYVNDKQDYLEGLTLADVERGFIIDTYNFYGGNQTLTAKKLGISRSSLIRKVNGYKTKGYIA